jgi:hypothetical protein
MWIALLDDLGFVGFLGLKVKERLDMLPPI